jgi:hypothetical protein
MPNGSESWTVLGPGGDPVPEAEAFLAHVQALNRSPTTVRTYATTLKLWLEFPYRDEIARLSKESQALYEQLARNLSVARAAAVTVPLLKRRRGHVRDVKPHTQQGFSC